MSTPAAATTRRWKPSSPRRDLCLIPARPSPADIEATALTLRIIRDNDKPFAFVRQPDPAGSYRLADAAAALSDVAVELHLMGVLALPYIVLRNDQQDGSAPACP